jgi:hypothetical protein
MYAAALDERISASIISGAFGRFADALIESAECACQYVPGLLRLADLPDIVSLIAPRPLLIQSGLDDQHYTREVVDEAHGVVERAYTLSGAAASVALDRFDGGHVFNMGPALDWLDGRV